MKRNHIFKVFCLTLALTIFIIPQTVIATEIFPEALGRRTNGQINGKPMHTSQ